MSIDSPPKISFIDIRNTRVTYTRGSSKFQWNSSVVRGDETRGKRSFLSRQLSLPLSISRLFHQRALLKRATRVLYVCFSFPAEKSLIISHVNGKRADRSSIFLPVYFTIAGTPLTFTASVLLAENYFFLTTSSILVLKKSRKRRKKEEREPPRLIKWCYCRFLGFLGIFYSGHAI